MQNYIDLIADILENGISKDDRTGVGNKSVFGRQLRWDLSKGFPAITTRPSPFRIAFEETMFFLRGETDTKILEEKNVNIWKGNTTREFLDNRDMQHYPEGNMGLGYSHQWRNFGGTGPYSLSDYVVGTDQVKELIDGLRSDPNGRRHIISAWNPNQLKETALPPCHILQQYLVFNGKLNSIFYMRSNDVIYGLPFNIMGYALLNHLFAKLLNLEPGELVYSGADVHIYNNQIEMAEQQILRKPGTLPTLIIHKDISTLDELLSLEFKDVTLEGYNPQPDFKNKPGMAI